MYHDLRRGLRLPNAPAIRSPTTLSRHWLWQDGPAKPASTTTTCAVQHVTTLCWVRSLRSMNTFASLVRPTTGRRFRRPSILLRRRSRRAKLRLPRGPANFDADAQTAHRQLSAGLSSIAPTVSESDAGSRIAQEVVINPWNFSATQFAALNPLDFSGDAAGTTVPPRVFADVPGCGFAEWQPADSAAVPLVEGRTLRNETLELTVSDVSGGIQSLRSSSRPWHADFATAGLSSTHRPKAIGCGLGRRHGSRNPDDCRSD